MAKININELSIGELRKIYSDFFPESSPEDIINLPIGTIQAMITDEIENSTSIDPLGENEENFGIYSSVKHCPTRKKKAKRLRKKWRSVEYKKIKKGDWAKHSRRRIKDSETTNRTFINKASKSYTPNRTQKHI